MGHEKQYLRDKGLERFVNREEQRKEQKHQDEYQIWIADLYVMLGYKDGANPAAMEEESFPVGLIVLRLSPDESTQLDPYHFGAQLLFYRVRDYYRQMRLFEKMLDTLADRKALPQELKEALGKRQLGIVFNKGDETYRLYGHLFKRHSFAVVITESVIPTL